ncbi:MAG: substrate-binding domain-containing protein [Desulfobacterota bacterium]|nr:substrate-binding domain-containing protein [Thermodesulfobacteriota bacterium]
MVWKILHIGAGLLWILFVLPLPTSSQPKSILLATTTSLLDCGLLDVLLPVFESKTGYSVKPIGVGSGQAIVMAKRGEADVLLVHSPEAERRLLDEGHGIRRRPVMFNTFLIVGPVEDPAGVRKASNVTEAFRQIASRRSLFLSRGDRSGTHEKERSLWKASGIDPERERWYQETGLGMGQTLHMASEKGAYTLTDSGTYLALRQKVRSVRLGPEDPLLLNVYHVIEVNPSRWPKVNGAGARAFSDFLFSKEAQEIILSYGVGRYGARLFLPVTKIDGGH